MRKIFPVLVVITLLLAVPAFAESYYTGDPAPPPQDQGGDAGTTSGGKKIITCTATYCEDEVVLLLRDYDPGPKSCALVRYNASCLCTQKEDGTRTLEGSCTRVNP